MKLPSTNQLKRTRLTFFAKSQPQVKVTGRSKCLKVTAATSHSSSYPVNHVNVTCLSSLSMKTSLSLHHLATQESSTSVRSLSLSTFWKLLFLLQTKKKCDAIIFDGSSLVHSLSPKASVTFEDYAVQDVIPKI